MRALKALSFVNLKFNKLISRPGTSRPTRFTIIRLDGSCCRCVWLGSELLGESNEARTTRR